MKMNSATLSLIAMTVWISQTVSPPPVRAQNPEFQIGQTAQPARPATPSQTRIQSGPLFIAPMTSPIQPTANPLTPITGAVTPQQTKQTPARIPGPGFGEIPVLPPGGIVFVPAGTLVIQSGPDMQPGTFLAAPAAPAVPAAPATPQSPPVPSGSRGGGTSIDRSNRSTNIGPLAAPPVVSMLALGTSRERVIEKYGNPIAFVMNMNGETLYFSSGVVVFLRDGVVAVPAIPDSATRP